MKEGKLTVYYQEIYEGIYYTNFKKAVLSTNKIKKEVLKVTHKDRIDNE